MLDHLINPDEDPRAEAVDHQAEHLLDDEEAFLDWREEQDPALDEGKLEDMWLDHCWERAEAIIRGYEEDAAEARAERRLEGAYDYD